MKVEQVEGVGIVGTRARQRAVDLAPAFTPAAADPGLADQQVDLTEGRRQGSAFGLYRREATAA